MPQIIYSDRVEIDLIRVSEFMAEIEPNLKSKVVVTILEGIEILKTFPQIAKPSQDEKYKHMRELFISFGKSGYSVLYEYDMQNEAVYIASIRHSREAGYTLGG